MSLRATADAESFGRVMTVLAWVALSIACCGAPGYEGDGKATGFGVNFEVQLGALDTARAGRHVFRMTGLSRSDLVVGFRTTQRPIDVTVNLSLTNARGQVVIQEEAPLADWVWSHAVGPEPRDYFVYRRGENKDIPLGNGSVRVEPVGMRADGGWGSYFHPRAGETYKLSVRVVKPAPVSAALKAVVKCAEVYSP